MNMRVCMNAQRVYARVYVCIGHAKCVCVCVRQVCVSLDEFVVTFGKRQNLVLCDMRVFLNAYTQSLLSVHM